MTTPIPHTDPRPAEARGDRGPDALTIAAVAAVLALHAVTLLAAFTRTDPHPPLGFVPFIAANLAVGMAAIPPLRASARSGHVLALVFAVWSLASFGPHKLLTADMPEILPAVAVGLIFSVIAALRSATTLRRRGRTER